MEIRKFTQFGTFTVAVMLPLFILFMIMLILTGFDNFEEIFLPGFLALTMLICLLIFYKLTIYIDESSVSFKLGTGLIHRKYQLSDITSCRPVKNAAIYGIGIRMTPDGWLYNVSGLYAVELTFNNNKKVRIGTDKPEEVSEAINSMLNNKNSDHPNTVQSKSHRLVFWSVLLTAILVPLILIISGNREIKIDYTNTGLKINGMYGMTINYSDIRQADTLSVLPKIKLRTNGYAFANTLKGNFKLQDGSKVKLFIKNGNPPYIFIYTNETGIYLNFSDPDKTVECFNEIVDKMN